MIVAALLLPLAACAPESGDIIKKDYDAERTWTELEPDYDTKTYSCKKTKTTTVNGKSKTEEYTATCTKRVQDGYDEVEHYEPERYRLQIRDGDDTGWVEVDEATYEDASVGDYYENGEVR